MFWNEKAMLRAMVQRSKEKQKQQYISGTEYILWKVFKLEKTFETTTRSHSVLRAAPHATPCVASSWQRHIFEIHERKEFPA